MSRPLCGQIKVDFAAGFMPCQKTIPVKIRTQLAQFEITMTATEVKNGVTIEDGKFAKPKP